MNPCWRCQNPMLNDQPQLELLCHHRMHTACFLQIAHLDYTCPHCNQPMNPNVQAPVQNPNPTPVTQAQLKNLYETNAEFKTFAKTIATKRRMVSKAQSAYSNLLKTKKQEIREQLLTIKAQLEGLTETKKTEIRDSQAYKDYLVATRGYKVWIGKLRTKYNCSERKFAFALNETPGFRRFHPIGWRQYRRFKLNHIFYYKIRI